MKANMKLAGNRSKKRMLNVVAIVFSVLQTATLSDALAYNERVYGESVTEWTCENDVTTCEGLAKDRLNYTIKCISPDVVNVGWKLVPREKTPDVYHINAQYSCYNRTSREKSTWVFLDHSTDLEGNVVIYNVSMGDDVSCTFTACTFGAKLGRSYCYDYIHENDEETIDSTCFENGDSKILSSEASSMVLTPTSLLQQTRGLEVDISSISIEPPFSSPMSTKTDAKSPNVDDDAIIVILCVGFIFVGLVSLSTFVLACHGCKKKTKMNDTLYDTGVVYKPKPTENLFSNDFKHVSVSGSLLTLLEPLQFFTVEHREKALMIHMESSSEGFTHVGEDNDDPDGKCTNDNVSLTTVRLDDVHSLKDMCTCLHPNSECLPEYSVDTPVHSQHQINGHATKALSAHKTVSSKTVRSTGQLSSAMTTGYISTGYISDSNSSHLPHFRSGFTLSVSTDGYVGDINLQPELQEAPVVAFSEDNIEPSFINSNDDCVFDSSSSMRCGLPFHHSPGILPIADIKGEVIGVEEGSQQAHTLSLSASEYVRNFHSHQLHCSAPISTSSDDRDGFSISPMSSGGYICGYPCIARHDDNEVRGLDSAQSQPSAPLTFLFHDKNSSDYSCNSNLPTSAIRELVPTRKQPSVSLSASVVDGYIHDSSCIPPSPTDAVHEHSQPSMLPSALDNDGSIGESSLSHQLHPSSPIRTPSGDHDCAPISLTASDGYVCEFPCNSPLLDNVFRELVPAHKQPSAPSTTISHAANSNDSSCPNLPDATTHKLVPTHNQPSVSPSIPAIDGYIHNSSCTALPPTGIPHGHSQPSTPPSSLPSQPSTPVADGYIHDSSCIPQPAASAAHRHNESSALESDGYICNSSHCPPISTNADCGIISTLNQLPTPQLSSESDGYIYDPSCISPTSMHAASGLDEVHRQPSAGSSTSSTSDGYIEDPGDTRLCKLLPSTENEGYILASGSYQPFATLPATASDSYICNSYSTPSSSSASASKSKGEVSRSAEHPHLSFLSDTNTTTGLVDTSQLQPQTGCSQHPNTTNDVMRNVKLQIAIDFPTQALPLSSDYVTESSLPPRVDCSSTRTYSIPGPLQVDGSNYLDRDTLCRGTNTSVDSMYRHESKYTHEEIPKVCMDPAVHPVHEPYTRGTMLNKQAQKSDSSPEALQIGVDGYITTPLHCQ